MAYSINGMRNAQITNGNPDPGTSILAIQATGDGATGVLGVGAPGGFVSWKTSGQMGIATDFIYNGQYKIFYYAPSG